MGATPQEQENPIEEAKKRGVTSQLMKAMKGQIEKIVDSELLTKEESGQLVKLYEKLKTNWIKENL